MVEACRKRESFSQGGNLQRAMPEIQEAGQRLNAGAYGQPLGMAVHGFGGEISGGGCQHISVLRLFAAPRSKKSWHGPGLRRPSGKRMTRAQRQCPVPNEPRARLPGLRPHPTLRDPTAQRGGRVERRHPGPVEVGETRNLPGDRRRRFPPSHRSRLSPLLLAPHPGPGSRPAKRRRLPGGLHPFLRGCRQNRERAVDLGPGPQAGLEVAIACKYRPCEAIVPSSSL